MRSKFIIVTIVIFVLLTAVFFALMMYAPAYHFAALETANAVMAMLTLSSYIIVKKQISERPQAFVRGVYSASFLKLMVCMISILVYVLLNRAHIHKASVFVLFGIYTIYTVAETILLSKMAREE